MTGTSQGVLLNNPERIARLRSVVEAHPGRYHILVAQVDPDALGCAMGVRFLLRQMGVAQVDVYYSGAVGHPQNRAIIQRYNLSRLIRPVSERTRDSEGEDTGDDGQALEESEHLVLVDSSKIADVRFGTGFGIDPIIVIDHHQGCDIKAREHNFVWVDEVGAASTLVSELIDTCGYDLDAEHHYVAVLLALGIYTDTKSLVSGGKRDRDAYGMLTANIPPHEISDLIEHRLPSSHFDHLTFALTHLSRSGSRLVANAGLIDAEHGDDLSTIADYLIRMEGVSLVIVWGIVGAHVRISARNTELGRPLHAFLKKRFGDQSGAKLAPDGRGEGGALLHLDLGFWMSPEATEEILAMVSKRLKLLVFSD